MSHRLLALLKSMICWARNKSDSEVNGSRTWTRITSSALRLTFWVLYLRICISTNVPGDAFLDERIAWKNLSTSRSYKELVCTGYSSHHLTILSVTEFSGDGKHNVRAQLLIQASHGGQLEALIVRFSLAHNSRLTYGNTLYKDIICGYATILRATMLMRLGRMLNSFDQAGFWAMCAGRRFHRPWGCQTRKV